jgi:hypothetical protein
MPSPNVLWQRESFVALRPAKLATDNGRLTTDRPARQPTRHCPRTDMIPNVNNSPPSGNEPRMQPSSFHGLPPTDRPQNRPNYCAFNPYDSFSSGAPIRPAARPCRLPHPAVLCWASFPYVRFLSGLPAPKSVFNTPRKMIVPRFTRLSPPPDKPLALSQRSKQISADQPFPATAEFCTKVTCFANAKFAR